MPAPYQVWIKQSGIFHMPFASHSPSEATVYAFEKVCHGNNIERIEIRDLTGVLNTVFDSSWVKH